MIRLIKFLLTGDWHLHKWVDIKEVETIGAKYDGAGDGPVIIVNVKFVENIRNLIDKIMNIYYLIGWIVTWPIKFVAYLYCGLFVCSFPTIWKGHWKNIDGN